VRRILHTDLHLHPYKIMIRQELSPADWGRRMDCCNGNTKCKYKQQTNSMV
jgi:hypothetical protein